MGIRPESLLILVLIISAVAVTACISQPRQELLPAPALNLTTVKVAYMPLVSNGPLFIAKEEGYFARQGIDVEFEKFQSSSEALPVLINGDIAVSGGQLTPGLANSIAKGARVRITADKGRIMPGYCNSTAFLVRRDLIESGTVKTIADLKGRKIAATSDQSYGVYRALALGNLTPSDVETVDMANAASIAGFENGAIDAGLLMEPYVTQAVSSGKAVVFLGGQEFIPNFANPLYYGPTFLDKDPDLGRRFMVAYLQGVRQYNEGKTDRNVEILSNYTHLDRALLEQSCWAQISPTGDLPRQSVHEYVDWMYANKKVTQNLDDDQLFDMSYVNYANNVLENTTNSTG
jgi:NitT/TauT family transport system substrate-binding protein